MRSYGNKRQSNPICHRFVKKKLERCIKGAHQKENPSVYLVTHSLSLTQIIIV